MSIYMSILEWSEKRPIWQRDCLRRIITQEKLSQLDIAELIQICLQEQGIETPDKPKIDAMPLTAAHVTQSAATNGAVAIKSIEDTCGINGLAQNQKLLLSPTGITVIYGDNAAGKSGYARVLKRVCRARGAGSPVTPNALAQGSQPPASATIHFQIGNKSEMVKWSEGVSGPAALSAVSVFDSLCASTYVTENTDVAFTPAGLDVFAKLAQASELVANAVQNEIKKLDSKKQNFVGFNQDTSAGKAVAGLNSETNIDGIEKVAKDAAIEAYNTPELQKQLMQLEVSDPKKLAKEYRLKATKFTELAGRIEKTEIALNDFAVSRLREKQVDATSKQKAASIASSNTFKDDPLDGVGSDPWKLLWAAARAYSVSQAYPSESFPVTHGEALCVLCHQELSDEACERLRSFDEFVKQATQTSAKAAEQVLAQAKTELESLAVTFPTDSILMAELGEISAEAKSLVSYFLDCVRIRKDSVLHCLDKNDWEKTENVLPKSGVEELKTLSLDLNKKATELDNLDIADEVAKRKKQLAELQARQLVLKHKDEIIAEVHRLKRRKLFEAALKDTNTTGITAKNTELSKTVITGVLRDRFSAELKALGMTTLPISFDPVGGAKGSLRYKIGLESSGTSPFSVDDIASEGEHRSIALACFLSELATEPSRSALIFDDPVSSLDHTRRRKVAERLMKEAVDRQVVIFTHDIAFVMLLNEVYSRQGRMARADVHILRKGSVPGFCVEGLPWGGMTAEQRIKALRNDIQKINSIHKSATDYEYGVQVAAFYGRLQEAWERAIEGVLLNDVINRVERPIQTQRLKLVDVVPSDYDAVLLGMGTCSKWRDGHDEPSEINEPYPSPDDAQSHLDSLDKWIKEIKSRRELTKLKAKENKDEHPKASHLTIVSSEQK
ncbi:MAG: AAA family ATPase [Bdellovibrionales bacterium]|nr:AAA family ATPase [Bdellovibrionales bacterium]